MSYQTQQIAFAKVSMPRFYYELNRSVKEMHESVQYLVVDVMVVLSREPSMTN